MNSLDGFLVSVGAHHINHGEYEFETCWRCGGRQCAYFNVVKQIGVCHKCPMVITLRMLAEEVAGIPYKQLREYADDFVASERKKFGFKEAMLDFLLGAQVAQIEEPLSEIDLPDNFRTLSDGQYSVIGRKAIRYMVSRNFSLPLLFEMQFGYCDSGKYAGRVIIPFYENNRLVYWQARDFTGQVPASKKVVNPSNTPHGKSDVLFNYDAVRTLDTVILTESWGSSLAVGPQAFAINGKNLSDEQLRKISHMKCSRVIVLLDAGTEKDSWIIGKKIHASQKYTTVCELPTGDPNEVPRSVLLETIRGGREYSDLEHIRAVARGLWK